ncbi:hypothetical protein D5R93_01505 [Actinomyces lilanjuaniae]|uniref:Uncharacterized protein n=1 Tax=Actinomyces lilanjuaniae TaxID=2321394 RepID=A0ABM6Z1B0_9ACTO|nr:hypothetical protein D5R93_01505 [Actinomyces lilanjuaniae]
MWDTPSALLPHRALGRLPPSRLPGRWPRPCLLPPPRLLPGPRLLPLRGRSCDPAYPLPGAPARRRLLPLPGFQGGHGG